MKEIWKDIEGYDGIYKVSNLGRVKSLNPKHKKSEYVMNLKERRDGYNEVHINYKNSNRYYSVHRLVAKAFIQNPNNYPCVNHKNENKKDNRVENLEWCSKAYNNTYGTRLKRCAEKLGKKVCVYNKETNTYEFFNSMAEIKRKYKFSTIMQHKMIEEGHVHHLLKNRKYQLEYYI